MRRWRSKRIVTIDAGDFRGCLDLLVEAVSDLEGGEMYGTLWISPDDFEKGMDSAGNRRKRTSNSLGGRASGGRKLAEFCQMYENSSRRLQKQKKRRENLCVYIPLI